MIYNALCNQINIFSFFQITSVYSSFSPGVSLSCSYVLKIVLSLMLQSALFVLNCFLNFLSFSSHGLTNRARCSINVNYQSLAGDELVLLQDKLLLPVTRTELHSMESVNGRILVDIFSLFLLLLGI